MKPMQISLLSIPSYAVLYNNILVNAIQTDEFPFEIFLLVITRLDFGVRFHLVLMLLLLDFVRPKRAIKTSKNLNGNQPS